jgi:hypothetical protein
MRRTILVLMTVLGASVALAPSASPGVVVGSQTITVTKTVEGPGPIGPYEIDVSCVPLNGAGPGEAAPQVVSQLTMLVDGESATLDVSFSSECTVTEFVDQGAASVVYACTPGSQTVCTTDNTVEFTSDVADAQVDITNIFPPDDTGAAAPDQVVRAAPAFTG